MCVRVCVWGEGVCVHVSVCMCVRVHVSVWGEGVRVCGGEGACMCVGGRGHVCECVGGGCVYV